MLEFLWIRMNSNALFRVGKMVKRKYHMHKMHNTSSSSYQSICLIKVNVKNNNNNNNNLSSNDTKIGK